MVDVAALVREREAAFIEARTKIEVNITKFIESIDELGDEIKHIEGRPAGATAKEWLPELWNSNFNIDTYNQQLAVVQSYIDKVAAFADEINRESLRCLQS